MLCTIVCLNIHTYIFVCTHVLFSALACVVIFFSPPFAEGLKSCSYCFLLLFSRDMLVSLLVFPLMFIVFFRYVCLYVQCGSTMLYTRMHVVLCTIEICVCMYVCMQECCLLFNNNLRCSKVDNFGAHECK